MPQISISVMAHPKRAENAKKLYEKLNGMPFSSLTLVYDDSSNEWDTGKRSLLAHGASDWHIVLQDDAIIGDTFYDNVLAAVTHVPKRSLISLYTGRVRPFAKMVTDAVGRANTNNASWLVADRLMWGVGIAIPTEHIEPLLEFSKRSPVVYDRRIGLYYYRARLPVYYTNPSLVDHDHTLGSLIGNDYAAEPRVAHKFADADGVTFNSRVVRIRL